MINSIIHLNMALKEFMRATGGNPLIGYENVPYKKKRATLDRLRSDLTEAAVVIDWMIDELDHNHKGEAK